MTDTPLDQFIRLNDWLAEREPDAYHTDEDTATTVIKVLERLFTQLADREHDLAYEWDRANRAEAEVEWLRAALLTVEWAGGGIGDRDWDLCPWCGNYRPDGHRADCQRQAALGLQR